MTKKLGTRLKDVVSALAAIPDPTERAITAGELGPIAADAVSDIATIRSEAVRELRAQGLSYRAIGDKLGIHFSRVKQLETGATTGRRKQAATETDATE